MTQMNTQSHIDRMRAAAAKQEREKMAHDGINPETPEAAERMKATLDKVQDFAWRGAYEKSLSNLIGLQVPGITALTDEGDIQKLGSRFSVTNDDAKQYATLAADQFTKGMTPIKWAEYNNNKRGLPSAIAEGVAGSTLTSFEGMIGGVFGGAYSMYDMIGPGGLRWQEEKITVAQQLKHLQGGIDAAQTGAEIARLFTALEIDEATGNSVSDSIGYLEELAGPPGQPMLKSERFGSPGGDLGAAFVSEAEDVGAAIGSMPLSVPSMLARDPVTRAVAMIPFAFSGYGDAKTARYNIWKGQVQDAIDLGINPPPLPSVAEFETWGILGMVFEVGSEYIGDRIQVGAMKVAGGKAIGKWGGKSIIETLESLQKSMARTRGPVGAAKKFVVGAVVPGITEGLEETVPSVGNEFQDAASDLFFTPEESYWNDKGDREFWSENTWHSAKVGGYSGFLMGAGNQYASPTAFKNRRAASQARAEALKGTSFVTESLMQGQQQDAKGVIFPTRRDGSKSIQQFRRSVMATRSSAMAMHHVEQLGDDTRGIMVVDPADMGTTLTKDVLDRMNALGISTKPIGTIDGKKVFAKSANIQQVRAQIQAGEFAALGGNPLTNDGQLMMGAVVLRDKAGRVVEVMPYSDPAQMYFQAVAIGADAKARGLTMDVVNESTKQKYSDVVDSINRAQDADAAQENLPKRAQRPVPVRDTNRGVKALRIDIARSASGSKSKKRAKSTDPFSYGNGSGYLTTEEIGDATNGDVSVLVSLNKIDEADQSDGERNLSSTTDANATILDGKVLFSIKQKDGSVKTIEKPIRMDGVYLPQASPDGVFLVRENGTAMNARSAFAIALHEMRHRTLARSRNGAEYFAKLLQLDPVYAMRGGAQYMRQRFEGKFAGVSDAKIIAYYRGLHEATQAYMQGVATAEQEQLIADNRKDDAGNSVGNPSQALGDVRQFSEESVTTTSNRAFGQLMTSAAEWDGIHADSQERSFRKFSSWMANALVKNGFVGPEARQALFELQQRLKGVREEEIKFDRKFSDSVSESFKKDLAEADTNAQARQALQASQSGSPATPSPAMPAVSPSLRESPSSKPGFAPVGGDGDGNKKRIDDAISAVQEAQNAPPEQRDSMLTSAIGMLVDIVPLLGQTSAQLAPSLGITRPQLVSPRIRNLPEAVRDIAPPIAPATQPPATGASASQVQAATTELESSARRQRNAQGAMAIIRGDSPSEPVDFGTVARVSRTQSYMQDPEEEIRMSVRERQGRREANDNVRSIRNSFMDSRGIKPDQQIEDTYADVDPEFAKRVANWFESAKSNYDDPKTIAAYRQFGKETKDQYQYLVDNGYTITPWAGEGQPYADSADMLDDVRNNKRLYYFKTINPKEAASFGSDPAALQEAISKNITLEDAGIEVPDSDGNPYKQTYNDLFRAVHDILGHSAEGFQFGPRGEENAYRSHAVMFSPIARQAMATESRAQNSWLNFGPNRSNPDGSVWGKEDPRYDQWIAKLKEGDGYSEQKMVLTPTELTAISEEQPQARMSLRPISPEKMTAAMQVWSNGSKAKDESGNLIPLYHGTFAEFDKFRPSKNGAFGPGIYMAADTALAGRYSVNRSGMNYAPDLEQGSQVMPVVASIKNPLVIKLDVGGEFTRKAMKALGITSKDFKPEEYVDDSFIPGLQARLRAAGYDGLHIKEPNNSPSSSGNKDVWVAWDPNQVKGYFNANPTSDERIMYSQREQKPAKAMSAEKIAARAARDAERELKRVAAEQRRKEAAVRKTASDRRKGKLDKPAISMSAEVTSPQFLNPDIILPSAKNDPNFSKATAYARVNDRVVGLLRDPNYRTSLNALLSAVTNGRVTSIGTPRIILGSYKGRVEQSMRISIPGATHEDHILVSNAIASLMLQEASITIGEPTASTPKAEQSYAVMMTANPNISDANLRTLLADADKEFDGASTLEGRKGVWAVYNSSSGSGLTQAAFTIKADAFAKKHGLALTAAPVRSTYTITGAKDVLGRIRQAVPVTGGKNSRNKGIDPRWSAWVEAAAPIVEALRDEGFDINIPGWIKKVAGRNAAAVESALISALAERAAGGRHGLDWRFITRASVSGQGLTDGFAIPAKTTEANADASFAEVDALLGRHPNALKDRASFERFLIDLFKSRDIPIVPSDLIDGVADNFARMRKDMNLRENGGRLTSQMVDDALHGLDMAQRFRALYQAGKVTPTNTASLAMWGFLSRGVSPYIQESLFLDIVNYRSKDGRDLSYFVNKAIANEWTKTSKDKNGKAVLPDTSTDTEWRSWIQSMFADAKYEVAADPNLTDDGDVDMRNGSVGSAASHNANAFGVNFLGNIGRPVTVKGKTQSGLLHFHDALADPTGTGKTVRRVFASLGGSLGIDNKVVGFGSLVAGKTDISVYDRVRVRDHFDQSGKYPNIYDGFTVGYAVYDDGEKVEEFRVDSDFSGMSKDDRKALLAGPEQQAKDAAAKLAKRGPRQLDKNGKSIQPSIEPVKIAGLANLFNGARGIALYEAVENSLDPNAIFSDLVKVRPDVIPFANLGAEHWLNWVGYSAQEASHKTLDGLIQMVSNGKSTISNVWAKEGRYDTFHYGGEYGYADVGGSQKPMYHYGFNGVNWKFEPANYHAFVKSLSSFDWGGLNWNKQKGTKKPKFLVSVDSVTGEERTGPWHSDPMIGPAGASVIEKLADDAGVRMSMRDMEDGDALDAFAIALNAPDQNEPVNTPDPRWWNPADEALVNAFRQENIGAQTHSEAHELYLRMVKGNFGKPTIPAFTKYFDKDNALNGINPNDVWWHGGSRPWVVPNYNISPNQFGMHIGNFNQGSYFFERGLRQSSWEGEAQRGVMFPLYATALKAVEIRDQGAWEPERILFGMKEMEHISREEQISTLRGMYQHIGIAVTEEWINLHAIHGEPLTILERSYESSTRTVLARNEYLREYLETKGIDAIRYQNTVEGRYLSKFASPWSISSSYQNTILPDSLLDEEGRAFRDDQEAREREWNQWSSRNYGASEPEKYAMQKQLQGDRSSVIIWGLGQIKSASASNVGFRRSSGDIRASLRLEPPAVVGMYPEIFGYEEPVRMSMRTGIVGKADKAALNYIDQYEPLKRYGQIAAQKLGSALPDIANPYQGARVLTARLASMQKQAKIEYTNVLRDMHEHGIATEDMDKFLIAQHALNGGNQYIAAHNPRFPDGGTGMTNLDAQNVINRALASGQYGDMNRIAEDWRQMLRAGLLLRRNSGLITADLYNTLTTRYTHYVPLRGAPARPTDELFEDYDSGEIFGRGLSTQGRGMPKRYGRESMAEAVTSQVGYLNEDTMRRVERNKIAQRFLTLVNMVNDPMMAKVVRPTRTVDVKGVFREMHDPNWMSDPMNFGVYINRDMTIDGHDYKAGGLVVIQINNPDLAASINSPNPSLTAFEVALRHVNTAWRFVTTGMGNPPFAALNMVRDALTGAVTNMGLHGVRDTAQMMRRYPGAFKRAFSDSWFNPEKPTKSYRSFIEAGGDQIYWKENDLQAKATDFDELSRRVALRDPNDRSLARTLLGWYPAFFTAAETATRLAHFEQRLATGSSAEQAALSARDITVDFAKGGKRKAGLNTYYMFLNASLQGSVNVTRSAWRNKALAPALVTFGAVTAMMGRSLGGEDDETKGDLWDNISDKESNIVLMDPSGSGKYIKIPLPYGYNVFYSAGVRMADAAFGPTTAGDAVGGMLSDAMNAFNPMGGSGIKQGIGSAFAAFVPTMLRPAAELGNNQNWLGRPIFPKSFGKQQTPDAYSYFSGTPTPYIDVAEFLNTTTGGDEFESGVIDMSPNTMQYLVGYYLSGAGRNMDRLANLAMSNEPAQIADLPFLRSFAGDARNDTRSLSERYNSIQAKIAPDMNRVEAMKDPAVSIEVKRAILAKGISPETLEMGKVVDEADKLMRKINKAMKTATPEQRTNLLEARQRAMKAVIRAQNTLTPD